MPIVRTHKIGGIPWELIVNPSVSSNAKVVYAALQHLATINEYPTSSVSEISRLTGFEIGFLEQHIKELNSIGFVVYQFDKRREFDSRYAVVLYRSDPTRRKVYLMRSADSDKYKIGYSQNPEARAIQIGNPVNEVSIIYTVYGDRAEEKQMHEHFQEYRLRGEWFQFTDDLVQDVILKMKEIEQK